MKTLTKLAVAALVLGAMLGLTVQAQARGFVSWGGRGGYVAPAPVMVRPPVYAPPARAFSTGYNVGYRDGYQDGYSAGAYTSTYYTPTYSPVYATPVYTTPVYATPIYTAPVYRSYGHPTSLLRVLFRW